MRKIWIILLAVLMATALFGCGKASLLSPDEPVTLTMWHVYGEQADSPMNRLIAEFNATVGKEKGIVVTVTNVTSTSKILPQLVVFRRTVVDDLIDFNGGIVRARLQALHAIVADLVRIEVAYVAFAAIVAQLVFIEYTNLCHCAIPPRLTSSQSSTT